MALGVRAAMTGQDAHAAGASPALDGYHAQARRDLLELAQRFTPPARRGRALDVGCAAGVFAHSLFSIGFREVWGVEPDNDCARRAQELLTGIVAASFPATELKHHAPFDLIVFGDSLEHLADPWQALRVARSLMSPDGVLILSVPNVAHYTVALPLLGGRWQYGEAGLLDRAHLRFFTPASLLEAVSAAGFVPLHRHDVRPRPHSHFKRAALSIAQALAPHLVTTKVDLVCTASEASRQDAL